MPSIRYDIGYLKAGSESLESYLTSNVLFWPLHASSPAKERSYPRLTLGNLLLSYKRLLVRELTPRQSSRVISIWSEVEVNRHKWRDAWIRKANHEFSSRIRQWNHYINDLRQSPRKQEVYYHSEVVVRVIIELLIPEVENPDPELLDTLDEMDRFLQKILVPGPFLWEQDLLNGFDKKDYWFLWGVPKLEEMLTDSDQG